MLLMDHKIIEYIKMDAKSDYVRLREIYDDKEKIIAAGAWMREEYERLLIEALDAPDEEGEHCKCFHQKADPA